MLNILGVGHAYPPNIIDNKFLAGIPGGAKLASLAEECGIKSRHTVLPLDYISTTGNEDIRQAAALATATPTDLVYQASSMALERAGIAPQAIGLVLADNSTPLQTTPSEAQRLADRFELRVPAYDVCSSGDSFILHADIMHTWREDRIPDYVLSVSSNTPTRCISYKDGVEGAYFGDGAAVVIYSPRLKGKFSVSATASISSQDADIPYIFNSCNRAQLKCSSLIESINVRMRRMIEQIKGEFSDPGKIKFIGSQISLKLLQVVVDQLKISQGNHWYNLDRRGYILGGSPISVLSEQWDDVSAGDRVGIVLGGLGSMDGYVLLDAIS